MDHTRGLECTLILSIPAFSLYRDGLKGGPVFLSNSQARPGRNFSQPRACLIVHLCTTCHHDPRVVDSYIPPFDLIDRASEASDNLCFTTAPPLIFIVRLRRRRRHIYLAQSSDRKMTLGDRPKRGGLERRRAKKQYHRL